MTLRVGLVVAAAAAVALSGCSSMRTSSQAQVTQPEQLQPLPSSTVAQNNLPPIGRDGAVTVATPGQVNPNLTGQPMTTGPTMTPPPLTTATLSPAPLTPAVGAPVQTAKTDTNFVTLDSVGTVSSAPGRDLTGGLSETKLIGGWTVVSGPTQCRLNLTQTAKSGTSRYRASTPGCSLPGLAAVSSWQLAGSQVQLFDENNNMVAALILSGNRFIGTLAGGQGITMTG